MRSDIWPFLRYVADLPMPEQGEDEEDGPHSEYMSMHGQRGFVKKRVEKRGDVDYVNFIVGGVVSRAEWDKISEFFLHPDRRNIICP